MYEAFYGLADKPFRQSPDTRFFFDSACHNRAMAYLRYGLQQGEGFIVITGAVGTGKTMLVNNLFDELHDDQVIAAQIVSTQMDEQEVLRLISSSFGLAHDGLSKTSLLQNLEGFFRARRSEGRRVLLVVDEAQNLPSRSIEELRMLSNYQQHGLALLQSFLLGQPELKITLQKQRMKQVRQRIIAAYHLRTLDGQEMRSYIEHRLAVAGWKRDPLISDEAFAALFDATGGTPRRINNICERLLLFGAVEQLHKIERGHVETVVTSLAEETGGLAEDVQDVTEGSKIEGFASSGDGRSLEERVKRLEREVEVLRSVAARNRRLVKKAIMLQLEKGDETNN